MKLSILVPVYNEERAVKGTLQKIKEIMNGKEYEIIVINDGSKDRTGKIVKEIKGVTLIENPYNLGYGASLKKGIKKAKGEFILITDADGTYPIEAIPKLMTYANKYDMVVGARTGKNVNVPLLRKPAKWFISMLANFLSGRRIPDINSGLRVFRRDIALEFFHLFPSGFSFTTTITLACFTNDYTVKYIPINYYKRTGKSSINPFKDFFMFIGLIFRVIMYFQPLKFFLWPGILLLFAGIVYGIYQYLSIQNIAQLPIFLVITGLQVCFLGLVSDLVVKSRNTKIK